MSNSYSSKKEKKSHYLLKEFKSVTFTKTDPDDLNTDKAKIQYD